MPKFARSAVTFLSLLCLAGSTSAADLRDVTDPKKVAALASPQARLRLINVWATWCIPCIEEMPDLRAIDEAFGPEVAVIGVSLDDMLPGSTKNKVTTFLDKQAVAFPNAYYTGSPDALGELLDFTGEIPITIVTDQAGKELWRHQGRINRHKTIATLRDLLRRKR